VQQGGRAVIEEQSGSIDLPFVLSRARRWLFLFLFVFVAIAGLGLIVAMVLPTIYRSEALLVVESEQIPDDLAQSTVRTKAGEQLQIIEQRVLSREVLINLADRLRIFAAEGVTDPEALSSGAIVEDLRSRILITPSNDGPRPVGDAEALLVRIAFDSPNPDVSAAVANELVTLILEEDVATRIQLARQTQAFFQQEVARLEQELSTRSQEIQAYKEENINALPDSLMFRRQDMAMIEERLVQLDRDRRVLLDQIDRIDRLTGAQPTEPRADDGTGVEREQVTTRDVRRGDLMTELSYLDQERDQLTARSVALSETIAETPRVSIRLEALERDYQNVRSQYDLAISNLAKAEIGELIESLAKGRRISVIEQAVRPDRPYSPNRPQIALIGIAAALATAIGLIVALETLRNVIRRPEDITAVIGDRMIMTLPYVRTRSEMTTIWMVSGLTLVVALGLALVGWQNSAELGRMLAEVLDRMKTFVPAGTVGGV
jgi:uncharacterized protein involved in exopolysaccharide biosynthesis